jgi:short-subunit dehydrogenase
MDFKGKYGPGAVIAGAAEGLGEAWSRSLARRGMDLLMVDRQEDKLHDLARQLREEYGIKISALCLDLAKPGAANAIMEEVQGSAYGLLVYNAAFSRIRPFLSLNSGELDAFIHTNTLTQLQLVNAFANYLAGRGSGGGLLLMSSLAGLIGMRLVAPYAATKAFTWNLAEAISHELKPHNIDVMACIAGATATPAYLQTQPTYGWLRPQVMEPERVAEVALRKFGRKTLYIAGRWNRINYFILTKILPRRFASRIANNTMKRMYPGAG